MAEETPAAPDAAELAQFRAWKEAQIAGAAVPPGALPADWAEHTEKHLNAQLQNIDTARALLSGAASLDVPAPRVDEAMVMVAKARLAQQPGASLYPVNGFRPK
jgi:hypothetical protein